MMRNMMSRTAILAAVAGMGLSSLAMGVDVKWLANPQDGDWGNPNNWDGLAVPASGSNLIFEASTVTTVTLDQSRSIHLLYFRTGSPSYTLNAVEGAGLTIDSGGGIAPDTNATDGAVYTINIPITFSAGNGAKLIFNNKKTSANPPKLVLNGDIFDSGSVSHVIQLKGDANTAINEINGVISSAPGATTNLQFIAKVGSWTLSNANTYVGSTLIDSNEGNPGSVDATLFVTGSIGPQAPVTVKEGTLAGTGTIYSSIDVQANGIIAPGNKDVSVGTFHVADLALGGKAKFEIASLSSFDRIASTGAVTFGGVLDVTFSETAIEALTGTHTWDLFDFVSQTGAFTSINTNLPGVGVDKTVSFNTATGELTVTVVPEPTSLAGMAIAALGLLARRRKLA